MRLFDWFKELLIDNEEKIKFKKAFEEENALAWKANGSSDYFRNYQTQVAWEMYTMQKKMEEMQEEIDVLRAHGEDCWAKINENK